MSHLSDVGEGYFRHMGRAFRFSARLLKLSGVCFAHGLFPERWARTTSNGVIEMAEELRRRRATVGEKRDPFEVIEEFLMSRKGDSSVALLATELCHELDVAGALR